MNPITVNSTNIVSFGFKATFDILNRQIKFSIAGLTVFQTGGAAAVKGVNFEVIDPSGVIISAIDFPTKDIDTAVTDAYNLPLPNGDGIFGTWKIKAVIMEADDSIYTATLPEKELCKPTGLEDDVVEGKLMIKVNCQAPYIQVSERTLLSYKNLDPLSKTKAGVLYYPRGTVADLSFTATPIQDNRLFTGKYTARLRTIATYDLGDNVYVEVTYDSTQDEDVTCKDRLCDIACCIEDTFTTYKDNCNNAKGKEAKEKLDKITIPLFVAQSKERCGKDASKQIKEIKEILNCDCNCTGQKIEAAPVQLGGGNAVVITGSCAAEVGDPIEEGSTITYPIKVKKVTFGKKIVDDLAFDIGVTETECESQFRIGWNYETLANTILVTIRDQSTHVLQDLLNTLIYNSGGGVVLTGLDGKCVIDLSTCNYLFSKSVPTTTKIAQIIINSTTYAAPADLLATDAAGILAWLSGLGKGTFTVTSVVTGSSTLLTIQSIANANIVNSLVYYTVDVDAKTIVNFVATCKSLVIILQAIIDYLCGLTSFQIKLGDDFVLCRFAEDGTKEMVTLDEDLSIGDYINELNDAFCTAIDRIIASEGVTCDKMKTLHPFRSEVAISDGDGIYMVKAGQCSRVLPRDLALFIYALTKTDAAVKAAFCSINCNTPASGCPDIVDFVAETGDDAGVPNITIPSVTYSTAQLVHQFLTIKYRLFGSPTWIVATTVAEAYANGNLVTPYVIAGLAQGAAYEVNIQVTPSGACTPLGTTKIVTTEVISETSIVTFLNQFKDELYTITAIKFDGGSNILGSPLSPGDFFTYDYSALGAAPYVIKMTFSGAVPQKMFAAQLRGMSQITGSYLDYTTGELTIIAALTPVSGDVIYVRSANEHLAIANYSADEGAIAPTCALPGFTITRNAIAIADAVANSASVDVEVQWDASNAGTATDTVTFAAADTSKGGSHSNIGSGTCSFVTGTILSAV